MTFLSIVDSPCIHESLPVVALMDSLIKLTQESWRANTVMV